MHALVINNEIQSVGPLPRAARRISDGAWVTPPNGEWTSEQAASAGYFSVTETPRPEDTATTTWDRNEPRLIDGVPTVGWTERPKTPEELAAEQASVVAEQLRSDTSADLTRLNDAIASLAILLGDNTVAGSWRTLRGSVTNQYSASVIRGIIGQAIDSDQATRRIARQVLRLAKDMVGDYGSADVGAE